jgi:hypothetical protein
MTLERSIDEYQAQMVEFKKDAANAGLDYGEPTTNTENFLHMDHIFSEFCSDLTELHRLDNRKQLKEMLLAS